MSQQYEKMINTMVRAIKSANERKTSGYDTDAKVVRVDGDTAWVHISGGVPETPVKKTISCREGDTVQVHVSGGSATLTGNQTAPPTDDRRANEAYALAKKTNKRVREIRKDIEEVIGEIDIDVSRVVEVVIEYCLSSSRTEFVQVGEWSEELPEYVKGKFYWTRTATYYDDGTVVYSDPVFYMAGQVAAEANEASKDATEGAIEAERIANAAKEVANQKRRVFNTTPTVPYDKGDLWFDGVHGNTYICKTSKTDEQQYAKADWELYATDVSEHFWVDSSGAHVAENAGDVTTGASQTIASAGTVMMRNGKLVTSWTGSESGSAALNFYDGSNPTAREADLVASYARNGITQYINNKRAMALTPSGLSFFDPSDGETFEAIFGSAGVQLYSGGEVAASFMNDGITFDATKPFTIGSTESFVKWVYEEGQWKIKIAADSVMIGGKSAVTSADVLHIDEVEYAYKLSTSGTTPPTGTWSTTPVAPTETQYAWTRTTKKYSDGSTSVEYTVGGKAGANGAKGDDGTTITSTEVRYATSTSGTSAPSSGWQSSVPSVAEGEYLWTRTTTTYSDISPTVSYSVAKQGTSGTSQYMEFVSSGSNAGLHIGYTNYTNEIVLTANGLRAYDGAGNDVAYFGSSGSRIGKSNGSRVEISDSAFEIYRSGSSVMHIGQGTYTDSIRIGESDSYHMDFEYTTLALSDGNSTYFEVEGNDSVYETYMNFYKEFTNHPYVFAEYDDDSVGHLRIGAGNNTYLEVLSNGYVDIQKLDSLRLYPKSTSTPPFIAYMGIAPATRSKNITSAVWYETTSGNYQLCAGTSSSKRYKKDIKAVENTELDPHRLYDISVVQFKFNDDYFPEDDPYYDNPYDVVGFIAEDVQAHYPIAVTESNEGVENWDARYLIPPMLKLIQEQHEEIEKLKVMLN